MFQPYSRVLTLLSVAALVLTARGEAQEVDAWRSQLELGFNGARGNSSFGILRTGASLTHLRTDRFEFEVSALVRYGKSDDRVIADDQRGSVKFDWKPESDFSPFVFVNGTRDQIRKLDLRMNGGLGAKWTFWRGADPDANKASFSAATLLDHENFALEEGSAEEGTSTALRWSLRFKWDYAFASGARVQHVTFVQPEFTRIRDYVLEMTNSASTRLLSNLSLALEHEYLHDAVPPPGAKSDDQKFSVVLRVSL